MPARLTVAPYCDSDRAAWERLVLETSANGTVLQTRRFLSYHPVDRFEDASFVVKKGSEVVAAVPAARVKDGDDAIFYSHPGSTYGGIIVAPGYLSAESAIDLVALIDDWLWSQSYSRVILKMTPDLFCRKESSSLEYALQHAGYTSFGELSFVIDFDSYCEPVETNFTARRRRDCRYGERAGCSFRRLSGDNEISEFYRILEEGLKKYETHPVHTLEELLDFKNTRLCDECRFYGVFYEETMIAGSMVFVFERKVFHTQYLAADPDQLELFPMNYLDWNLIRTAREEGFESFSFGISTEDHGRILNRGLARFKDGFGCTHAINRTFSKTKTRRQ